MRVSLELEPGPDIAARAREELRSRLGTRLPPDLLLDLLVVVSELVTNSFQHGPGQPIELRITLSEDGSVRGEIADHGTGEVAVNEDADIEGGFGLQIVDAVTDSWGVHEGTTHVWFELGSPDS